MNELTLAEIKQISLEVLQFIDKVCKKNCIEYFLAHGTLLGAVKYRGFIPWDDDIDICMTRKNFDKFVTAMYDSDRYKLLCVDNQKDYDLPLPKVIDSTTILVQDRIISTVPLGVYIDIFVLDNVPNTRTQKDRLFHKLDNLQKKWIRYAYIHDFHNPIKKALFKILKAFVSVNLISKAINNTAKRYADYPADYVAPLTYASHGRDNELFRKTLFDECTLVKFENMLFPAPKQYDEYLHQLYGNYSAELPPEQQLGHHEYKAFI